MTVEAWLLKTGASMDIAIASPSLIQLLDQFQTYTIPAAPIHIRQALYWQNHILPILNLKAWLDTSPEEYAYIAIIAYQKQALQPLNYGAIALPQIPEKIQVSDDLYTEPQNLPESVKSYLLSAIQLEKTTLIPDLEKLFQSSGE